MLILDGSYGEGGGQILRNAAAFAAILGQDICITQIRTGRPRPGLRRQHITGLNLLCKAAGAKLDGGIVGSQEIVFRKPHPRHGVSTSSSTTIKCLEGDTQTAGSICLLLQTILPFALLHDKPIRWVLKGGTNATYAPQYDYWKHVFLPILQKQLKLDQECIQSKVACRGFYPKGGGKVVVKTAPIGYSFTPIKMTDRGTVQRILIRSFYAGKCPKRLAEGMVDAAAKYIKVNNLANGVQIVRETLYLEPSVASGSGILVVAETTTGCLFGGSAVGSPTVSAEASGTKAAKELSSALLDGGCVDDYLQDQLILFMALGKGTSELIVGSLTLHTRTAIWVAEQCCDAKFETICLSGNAADDATAAGTGSEGRVTGRHLIRCKGIGFAPTT